MTTSRPRGQASGTSNGGGCGVVIFILIALGLAIEYWHVTVAMLAAATVVSLVRTARRRRAARHRPGPADPWCDEVAVSLADLGFDERARNQYPSLRGVPVLGNVELRSRFLALDVVLLADAQTGHRAEMALRADGRVRNALREGVRELVVRGSVLHMASGRRGVVDEALLDEAVRTVDQLPVRLVPGVARPGSSGVLTVTKSAPAGTDAVAQLRSLAALHAQGALSDDEFAVQKAELLKRI